MSTVGRLMTERAAARLIGRDRELAVLCETLDRDGPLVVFIHGLGGIGKTTLLAGVVERLGSFPAAVPVFDAYERFRLLDSWVRRSLAPRLPASARVVIASREPPPPGWDASPVPAAPTRSLPLGPLPDAAAVAVLREGGALDEGEARRLNRILRGHPLALRVAQAAATEGAGLPITDLAVSRAVAALTRLYLDDLDATTRRVVDAASTVRRATMSLLGALLPDVAPQDAFHRLQALPFVHLAKDGLYLHETMQEVTAEVLRVTDPARWRMHRRTAWHLLRREVAAAAPGDLWRYTADLLYLIEQPIVREAFFPSTGSPVTVEPAGPEDDRAIRAIIERHHRPGRADVLLRWWERLPGSFTVAKDRDGQVTGFDSLFEYRDARRTWIEDDPVTRRWLEHLRQDRLPRDQQVLFNVGWLDREAGEGHADSVAAFFLETKRVYMEMRPRLRRIYLALTDVAPYAEVAPRLGFHLLPEPQVVVEGVTYHSFVLDFGPGSVDGWLAWLVGSELGADADQALLDPDQLQVVLDGDHIQLSHLEFGVLSALVAREGRAVSRADLIATVWGTTYTGGSNIVDSVVRTLRRKLGDHKDLVQTVRGVGYRYGAS